MKIRVSKDFDFEMGHALDFHNGKCKHLRGHTYKLTVTIKGEPNSNPDETDSGMVMDFKDLKNIVKLAVVDKYDHSMVLNKDSKYLVNAESWPHKERLYLKDYQPTCENLLVEFVQELTPLFPKEIELIKVRLQETPNSFAEWFAEDN